MGHYFFVISLVAGILGFTDVASAGRSNAKVLFSLRLQSFWQYLFLVSYLVYWFFEYLSNEQWVG